MKKHITILSIAVAALLITSDMKAQWYGRAWFYHNFVNHSSANLAVATNAFVLGSYCPTRQFPTQADIAIDVISQNIFTSAVSFEYQINGTCIKPGSTHDCFGISVIENPTAAGAANGYALAGETPDGIFYATVNNTGVPVNTASWSKINPSPTGVKAIIKKSNIMPNTFYILADDGAVFHVMAVNSVGLQLWGKTYSVPITNTIKAHDIIENPYSTAANPEVIVVGEYYDPGATTDVDAFFMTLDASLGTGGAGGFGALLSVQLYDHNNQPNWFNSIERSISPNFGGIGFVLGGGSINGTNTEPWITKLDQTGTTQLWSNVIIPQNAPPVTYEIARVYERRNAKPNPLSPYEYYCVAKADYLWDGISPFDHMIVYKLDDGGTVNSFLVFPFPPTQIHFIGLNTPIGHNTYADITGIEAWPYTNDGFQVYGNPLLTNPPINSMIKSFFNGISGCDGYHAHCSTVPAPLTSLAPPSINHVDYMQCSLNNSALFDITLFPGPNHGGCTGPTFNGDNSRQGAVTSVNELGVIRDELRVYPNPTKGIVNVELGVMNEESIEISIYNSVSALVKTIMFNTKETQDLSIDFNALQVAGGFYLMQVKAGNSKTSFKVIYNPE